MDYVFQGLPLHVLLVHAVVIAVPVVAVLLVVLAAWPAARRVLWIPALVAAVLLVPLGLVTVEAGKWLQARVPAAPLIEAHTSVGESIVPWLWAVLAVAVLVAAWQVVTIVAGRRRDARPDAASGLQIGQASAPASESGVSRAANVVVSIVLTLVAIGVAVGAIWTVVLIGESGSRAVWEGSFSDTPLED